MDCKQFNNLISNKIFIFLLLLFRMQSVQNLGLAINSILSGLILEKYGYFALELFFLCMCLAGLIAAILLYFVDKFKSNIF